MVVNCCRQLRATCLRHGAAQTGVDHSMNDSSDIAADLSTPILLFCLASGTEWAEAGVTGPTITQMVDAAGRLVLTPDGRKVLEALLSSDR
jgi:hypothetical protein